LYGLSINANETIKEIVEKRIEMEKLDFDYVWIADVPTQRYSPTVASAIAKKQKIKIGLGLLNPFLHTPNQIASSLITLIEFHGNRFELCIGPGDRDQLRRTGILISSYGKSIPKLILKTKESIVKEFSKKE
jgi:5,10-methylenetetrahydromethanopterin reductase